ncbi:hypothetical protein D3C80_778800 [compost metagenome]
MGVGGTGRNDGEEGISHDRGNGHVRCLGDELEIAVIDNLDRGDLGHRIAHIGTRAFGGDLFQRPLHVGRGHLLAVGEFHVLEHECPGQVVLALPAFRQFADQLPLRIIGDEVAVDQRGYELARITDIDPGPEMRRIGGQADPQGLGCRSSKKLTGKCCGGAGDCEIFQEISAINNHSSSLFYDLSVSGFKARRACLHAFADALLSSTNLSCRAPCIIHSTR